MADRPMIPLAAFHLERDFLFPALVRHHVGDHAGLGHCGRAEGELALVAQHQHLVKSEGFAGFNFQPFDFQGVALGDPVLFTASL